MVQEAFNGGWQNSVETDLPAPTRMASNNNNNNNVDQEQFLTRSTVESKQCVVLDVPASAQAQEIKEWFENPKSIKEVEDEEEKKDADSYSTELELRYDSQQQQQQEEESKIASSLFPLPLSLQQSFPNDQQPATPFERHSNPTGQTIPTRITSTEEIVNIKELMLHEELQVWSQVIAPESVPPEVSQANTNRAKTAIMPASPTVFPDSQPSRTKLSSPPTTIMLAPVLFRTGITASQPPKPIKTTVPCDDHYSSDGERHPQDIVYDSIRHLEDHNARGKDSIVSNNVEVGDVGIGKESKLHLCEDIHEVHDLRHHSQCQEFSATAIPKDSPSTDNEDTSTTYHAHHHDTYQETLTDIDVGDDDDDDIDDDDDDDNKMTRKLSLIQLKLLLLLGCCIGTILLVGGSAGVATYMLEDAPAVPPTISPAPTITGMPSFAPSSLPTRVPSESPSLAPTLTVQPSTRPSVSPSLEPSSIPSSSPTRDFRSVLEGFLWHKYAVDLSKGGPPDRAANWVIQEQIQNGTDTLVLSNKLLQRFALVALEFSLDDAYETNTTSSRRQGSNVSTRIATRMVNECDWSGISCNDNGQVVRVNWSRMDWKGQIPEVVRLLFHLRELDLSDNDIGGSIPESLYSLASLERLYLFKNSIGGTISSRFGRLNKLTHWHLSHNHLNGSIPEQLKSIEGIRPLRKSMTIVLCISRAVSRYLDDSNGFLFHVPVPPPFFCPHYSHQSTLMYI
jgi:hypothetical protein